MRRNSALALLSALLVLLLCACGQDGEGAGGRSVALIVKSTGSQIRTVHFNEKGDLVAAVENK